ncbi:MAG: hypothetical protein ABI824_15135, partial [Acidobacteriota bacterium]
LQSPRNAENQIINALPQAGKLINKIGTDNARLLVDHYSAEQVRGYLNNWGTVQLILVGGILLMCVFAPRKHFIAIGMTAGMGVMVWLQYYFYIPELEFLGRQADFQSAEAVVSLQKQIWVEWQLFGGTEIVKLVMGGIFTSYLFASQASAPPMRKRRRSSSEPESEVAQSKG